MRQSERANEKTICDFVFVPGSSSAGLSETRTALFEAAAFHLIPYHASSCTAIPVTRLVERKEHVYLDNTDDNAEEDPGVREENPEDPICRPLDSLTKDGQNFDPRAGVRNASEPRARAVLGSQRISSSGVRAAVACSACLSWHYCSPFRRFIRTEPLILSHRDATRHPPCAPSPMRFKLHNVGHRRTLLVNEINRWERGGLMR